MNASTIFPLARCCRSLVLSLALLCLPAAAMAQEEWPRGHYPLPESGNMVGEVYYVETQPGQTLLDIGREHNVGYEEIRNANPDVSIWAPEPGTEVEIPARYILPPERREGVVINLSELRLYYYPDTAEGETPRVETYPIGIGREGFDTPLGVTQTTMKIKDPAWYPPESVRREARENGEPPPEVVPPGPDNPLGQHAILLGIPGYLIHGTNRPDGIGMRASRGCIRMMPETIEALFSRIPVGARVNIIDMPVKVGREGDRLYVQSFKPLDQQENGMGDLLEALNQLQADESAAHIPVDYARLRESLESVSWQPVELAPRPEEAIESAPLQWFDEILAMRPWYGQLETFQEG
ncbi:L,D-transpeptidase family protein [Halomonas daqiaonensis]|uniref:L,D-transpeptidase ErfK/SrfK n=1 Tax=Halomonas daqiaonensis TaxID=650850 RepID=A0A1H7VG90_9GAMM|nr:L,D-transpeptidase family protein [Halomonas daqiaonensis]SEM08301.1 L,D-transpeptidase ErfK/SrfK [Halomonas daqiaonensis]